MSEKYSTDELIRKLMKHWQWSGSSGESGLDYRDAIIARLRAGDKLCEAAKKKINIQAMDEGIWFVTITASEEYLQKELRELHAVIEKGIAVYEGKEGR